MTTAFREAWAAGPTPNSTAADRASVEACVCDYYESWYAADAQPDGWKIINALWRWADGHGPRA